MGEGDVFSAEFERYRMLISSSCKSSEVSPIAAESRFSLGSGKFADGECVGGEAAIWARGLEKGELCPELQFPIGL